MTSREVARGDESGAAVLCVILLGLGDAKLGRVKVMHADGDGAAVSAEGDGEGDDENDDDEDGQEDDSAHSTGCYDDHHGWGGGGGREVL